MVPGVTVAYLEGFRWVLEGTLVDAGREDGRLSVRLDPGALTGPGGVGAGNVAPGGAGADAGTGAPARSDRPGPGGRQAPGPDAGRGGRAVVPRPASPWEPAGTGGATQASGPAGIAITADGVVTLGVEPGAPVTINGRDAAAGALRAGDRVTIFLRRSSGTVRRVEATRAAVTGRVESVDALRGVLEVRAGFGRGRWVVDGAALVRRNGRDARLADLRPGDAIRLGLRGPGVASYVEAESVLP
ncbi:hypothetical protein Tmar_0148 [Thermaerobacter marianensis DSM 12885]|uniref:Uncharacterized protein n=1 Tax=Thermaerobacter marianensis (strain ATCC 700841 / DSM 12885 / JCM 10246 / 7p75a) TaxID=644966 RepID=E6SLK6_THEM7|nr:hypothetical protein [Thermaerobacter marianensis]ADU50273.1 hypothetical protein Tmar_0148 [Thermaerobacter marianensis DSM 12885]